VLDACSGAVVVTVGHGRTEVVDAIADQGRRVSYVHSEAWSTTVVDELAERLSAMAPGTLNRVFFCSGGSEATETALKLARQYHLLRGQAGKWRVVARRASYHGNTIGALSMSGHAARRQPYIPYLADFIHIDTPLPYRCGCASADRGCDACSGRALEQAIVDAGPDTISAFIAEPLIGAAAGAVPAPPGHFEAVREICSRYDVLFIADEVMTGLGRTGKPFGIQHWDAVPDLLVVGKGLASGYAPLAAVLASDEVHDLFLELGAGFVHGFTFSSHPPSLAAGLAVQKIVEREGLVERAASQGSRLRAGLDRLAASHPIVGDVRGLGLMLGLELVADRASRTPYPAEFRVSQRLGQLAFARGLEIYPGSGHVDGVSGDQVIIAPPLIISDGEIAELLGLLDGAFGDLERELSALAPAPPDPS
jgi:adenosylmethionine-8-amino-7-oxononanoate aminotransferase